MSKKTIEEFAKNIYPNNGYNDEMYCDLGEYSRKLFIEGAEWQQKESDIDTYLVAFEAYKVSNTTSLDEESLLIEFNEWFEQFKK